MGKPDARLRKFMETYKVDSDEVWEVRPNTYAIKHMALERLAAENKIIFDRPAILEINLEAKLCAVCVFATMGDRTEWSMGESAPYNTKPGYPAAMAEKRAKDRCVLKLLNAHGTVYSEEEADDFAQSKRQNPHVTRPDDIVPDVEYDEQGHPVDNIPLGNQDIVPMSKAQSRPEYAALQIEMRKNTTEAQLMKWGASVKDRVSSIHAEWQAIFRGQFRDYLDELRQGKAA